MNQRIDMILEKLLFRRSLKRWRALADHAEGADLAGLRRARGTARQMQRELDDLIRAADARLSRSAARQRPIVRPAMSDWGWRPELWCAPVNPPGFASVETRTRVGAEAAIFHDCPLRELTLRQIRNGQGGELAPFGLRFDVFRFRGSFLSLVIDLPEEAIDGLTRHHVVRLDTIVTMEQPIEIFARLNIRHGPNEEQFVRKLPLEADETMVEFDLAYSRMNEKRVERAWLDLIFDAPGMNRIVVGDLTMTRRPRADL